MFCSVLSAIYNIGTNQGLTCFAVSDINNKCQSGLALIQGALLHISETQTDMQGYELKADQRVTNILNDIKADTSTTREMSKEINAQVEHLSAQKPPVHFETLQKLESDMKQHLNEQSHEITELNKSVQSAMSSHLLHAQNVSDKLTSSEDATHRKIQDAADDLRTVLEQGFITQGNVSDSAAEQVQMYRSTVERCLQHIGNQLDQVQRDICPRPQCHEPGNSNQELIFTLQEKIQAFENRDSESSELKSRWHGDIKLVDTLRSRLKKIQEHFAKFDTYNHQLDELSRLSGKLQSSSDYPARGKKWVDKKLNTSSEPTVSRKATKIRDGNSAAGKLGKQNNELESHQEHSLKSRTSSENLQADTALASSQDSVSSASSKRVTVHSPKKPNTPSPAVSIEQEQKRRRGSNPVRPILKSSSSSSQESVEQDGSEIQTELGCVQKSQTMASTGNSSVIDSQKIIEEISSGFIPEELGVDSFNPLPQVGDCLGTEAKPIVASQNTSVKRQHDAQAHDTGRNMKRAKSHQNVSLEGLAHKFQKHAPQAAHVHTRSVSHLQKLSRKANTTLEVASLVQSG